jgi:hypothetical protein
VPARIAAAHRQSRPYNDRLEDAFKGWTTLHTSNWLSSSPFLTGSYHSEMLQRVATVYINGREYRVLATPDHEGDAKHWVHHFSVCQLDGFNSEKEVHDEYSIMALKVVKEELERGKQGSTSTDQRVLRSANSSIEVFISHSSADAITAEELINLLRTAIPGLRPEVIRCTSVPGYRLEGGAKTDDSLTTRSRKGLLNPTRLSDSDALRGLRKPPIPKAWH